MNEIISYKMCAVKVRNAKLRNYLKLGFKLLFFSILICVLKANLKLGLDCGVTKFPIQLFYNPWHFNYVS
jgi:hypothetical protein